MAGSRSGLGAPGIGGVYSDLPLLCVHVRSGKDTSRETELFRTGRAKRQKQ